MVYIGGLIIFTFTFIYSLSTCMVSFKPDINIPKFCKDCKYFINKDKDMPEFAKCEMFPLKNDNYFVDGIPVKKYNFCSTARHFNDMCGNQGKWFFPLNRSRIYTFKKEIVNKVKLNVNKSKSKNKNNET